MRGKKLPSVSEPGLMYKTHDKDNNKIRKKVLNISQIDDPYKYHNIYTINLTESKTPCEGVVNGENNCR